MKNSSMMTLDVDRHMAQGSACVSWQSKPLLEGNLLAIDSDRVSECLTSVSRKVGRRTRAPNVQELLECSVCSNSMYPPIHQCPNGHTLCSNCKSRAANKRCPTCTQELGNIRCLALEKVAASLELPCRYGLSGCLEILPYYTKAKHEGKCDFRPYRCPYDRGGSECSVAANIPTLVAHLRDDHKVDVNNASTFNHRYVKANPLEVENATWMLTVFNCYGHQFCLHFEAFEIGTKPIYMAFVTFMGNDGDAKKFGYSLETAAHGRKLVWQGVPRSIRDGCRKARESHDGLIIYRDMALYFSDKGGGDRREELRLKVIGRIWREH